ncbi:MAG: hypothetical protein JW828_05300 [Sedimentisphaerales bacterium]|nr:hypothetical protein [Sedimentisphaerales bacterium]
MIYDTFLFYNELDLLEIRLHELSEAVDWFVLLEASRTFTNKPKPMVFRDHKSRFADFLDRIIHIEMNVFEDVDTSDAWQMECYLRRRLLLGLQRCTEEDVILLSDVDEVPRAATVLQQAGTEGIKSFVQRESYYYVNCIGSYIVGTTMFPFRFLNQLTRDLQYFRGARRNMVSQGGWHFSYLGGVEAIRDKIAAFSHTECNRPQFTNAEHMESCLAESRDLFYRIGCDYKVIPLDESFPRYLVEHQDRFAPLIKPVEGHQKLSCPNPSANKPIREVPIHAIPDTCSSHELTGQIP